MNKSYINNAVIGNSSMLGCISDMGELIRLYWPNIDYPQHIEKMTAGIFYEESGSGTLWFDMQSWERTQRYIYDTNILETTYTDSSKGLKIYQTDYVLPVEDIMVRQYEIENNGEDKSGLKLMLYSSCISSVHTPAGTLFDFKNDSLIHYRHGYYISILADREASAFQLGNNAYESARKNELYGYDSIGMMNDGAVSWETGDLKSGHSIRINLFICASDTLKGVKNMNHMARGLDIEEIFQGTVDYWKEYLKECNYINELGSMNSRGIDKNHIINLYKRSLLLFRLMSDRKTGGLLASPEIDENFTKCGRYAYCWGRDAAFITGAMDRCGLSLEVEMFYKWAKEAQDEDGSWHQRYYMDGNLAPSWGLQIDETGTLIWGMLEHYKAVDDMDFLCSMWECMKKAVHFLVNFIDDDTGLPKPSFDLWEERFGEHAYSAAAVYGGICAGVEAAKILGQESDEVAEWENTAAGIKAAISSRLWKEEWERFIRSIRVKLNPWGNEPSEHVERIMVNPKGYLRDVTPEDWKIDVSMLGLLVPFEVFEADDYRIAGTVSAIEQVLTSEKAGGIRRYEGDGYIGGNPWVLTTLWTALYHIRAGRLEKARDYLGWAVRARTQLDLLPEQVDRESGKPIWVIPLTWSHAMFVHVLIELYEAGGL